MATNDFLVFGGAGGANVITQAAWAALAQRLSGFQSGVAQSAQLNKAWRQASVMAAVLGQFISDQSGQDAIDDGTTSTLVANLLAGVRGAGKTLVTLNDSGVVNAYTAVNAPSLVSGTWVDGVMQRVKIANANTGASTYSPDGLTAIPIFGLNLSALQGGELRANCIATLIKATIPGINSGNPICVLLGCYGAPLQLAPATQSNHAVTLGQFLSVFGTNGYVKIPSPVRPVIFQWGTVTTSTGADVSFTFPIAFPNAIRNAIAVYQNVGGSNPIVASLGAQGPSAIGVGGYASSTGARVAAQVNVFAIGD